MWVVLNMQFILLLLLYISAEKDGQPRIHRCPAVCGRHSAHVLQLLQIQSPHSWNCRHGTETTGAYVLIATVLLLQSEHFYQSLSCLNKLTHFLKKYVNNWRLSHLHSHPDIIWNAMTCLSWIVNLNIQMRTPSKAHILLQNITPFLESSTFKLRICEMCKKHQSVSAAGRNWEICGGN